PLPAPRRGGAAPSRREQHGERAGGAAFPGPSRAGCHGAATALQEIRGDAMLVNPKEYLVRARREGWALGGFNVFNLESARAVIAAGTELSAPLLVQTSEGAVKHAGLENLVAIVRQLASGSAAPIALHLDHGKSEALARAAVDAGYTSVMIDASRETFEENMRETRDIVAYAHSRGVHVEAELGTLAGIEDLGEQSGKSMLTDPD